MNNATDLNGMKEIAGYVRRSESTVVGWIRDMDFPAKKIGGIWEASKKEIDAWKKARANSPPLRDPMKDEKKKKIETRV